MNNFEKQKKITIAIANAIQKKDNTTDLLHHLKKEFPEHKDIKRFFNNLFDKEHLKNENVLNEEKSELNKNIVEYRIDELHRLYIKYVSICKKHSNLNCGKIVGLVIVNAFLNNLIAYDLLEKIEDELEITLLPQKIKERSMFGFYSPSILHETSNIYEDQILNEIKEIKSSLNIEKLTVEINLIQKILQNF
jgi:hypothetical protein